MGNIAAMGLHAAASLGTGLFDSTIKSASNLNESISKTKTIYGDAAGKIIDNADDMAKKFGLSRQEMLDASGIFGLMSKGAGASADASADFGNKMTKLAADAMSFYNVPMDVALEKIRAGLSGESEPLRAFGVFLSEDAVKAEALAMGLGKGHKTLTDGEKIMARASLIQKGLADANGDLERTFDGTENQTRKFWGTLTNLGQDIGSFLLPAFNSILSVGSGFASSLGPAFESMKPALSSFGEYASEAWGTFITGASATKEVLSTFGSGVMSGALTFLNAQLTEISQGLQRDFGFDVPGTVGGWGAAIQAFVVDKIELIGIAWRNLPKFFEIGSLIISEVIQNAGAEFTALGTNIGNIAEWIGKNWYQLITDALTATATALTNWGTNVQNLINAAFEALTTGEFNFTWTPLLEGFKSTVSELPAYVKPVYVSMKDDIERVGKEIAATESARAKAAADVWVTDEETGEATSKAAVMSKAAADVWVTDEKTGEATSKAAVKAKSEALTDTASFAEKLQMGQLGGDVQDKQLSELQMIRATEERNAANMEKMLSMEGKAVFA